jgi:hypothetical protein
LKIPFARGPQHLVDDNKRPFFFGATFFCRLPNYRPSKCRHQNPKMSTFISTYPNLTWTNLIYIA